MGAADPRPGPHGCPTPWELSLASATQEPTGALKTGNCEMGPEPGRLWPPGAVTGQAALQGLSPLPAVPSEQESAAGRGCGYPRGGFQTCF